MKFETISINISSNPEHVSLIRLMISAIASKKGFSIEEIDDMKVSISEAFTNAIKHSKEQNISIFFHIFSDKIEIEVKDNGIGYNKESVKNPDLENPKENGMGIFIMNSLMDKVEINSENNKGTTVKMTKYLGVDN